MRAARWIWGHLVAPLLRRPRRLQVAALCTRGQGALTEVLLVTSRGTGRWVLPKGWPMRGRSAAQAALQEAWEEAGVRRGRVSDRPVGRYTAEKGLASGLPVPVELLVFAVEVEDLRDDFPEAGQRRRVWVPPAEAAGMVLEPGLRDLLLRVAGGCTSAQP